MSTKRLITDTADLYAREIEFIRGQFSDDPIEYWRRAYIRTTISFFEAQTYLLKNELLQYIEENGTDVLPEIKSLLSGNSYKTNQGGKTRKIIKPMKITDEIKFVFNQICEIKGHVLERSYVESGWNDLIKSVRVRNRLTHPKNLDEQYVTDAEKEQCHSALEWYFDCFISFLQQECIGVEELLSEYEKISGRS